MTIIFPPAQDLRFTLQTDSLVIFDEVNAISRAVIVAANNSLYEATVINGTTMTNSTLSPLQTFNVVSLSTSYVNVPNHGFISGQALQLTTTNTLPAPLFPGFRYYAIVIDVNTIQFATTQSNALNGIFITLTSLGLGINQVRSFTVAQLYWQTWQHLIENRTYQQQMETVIRYFENLGYVIRRITNPITLSTLTWDVKW